MANVGSTNLLEVSQLQPVIKAAYSLIKIGQVRSAVHLLKPFTSELASSSQTNERSAMSTSNKNQGTFEMLSGPPRFVPQREHGPREQ